MQRSKPSVSRRLRFLCSSYDGRSLLCRTCSVTRGLTQYVHTSLISEERLKSSLSSLSLSIASNAVHLRLLVLQKHHDGIWIASLILVCISILLQVGLGFLLYLLVRGDVRNPQQQTALERFNIIVLVLVIAITVINVVINMFMLTINPRSFLDGPTLELLQRGRI